jgi:signal transduction histidine kinase
MTTDQQHTKLTLRIYVLTAILVFTAFSLTAVVFYSGRHMEKDRKLFVDSILKMRLDVTSAHLIHDEILHHEANGHKYENIQTLLDDAQLQLATLKKGQQQVSWLAAELNKKDMQNDLNLIGDYLQNFNFTTEHEVELSNTIGLGETIDMTHNKQFAGFMNTVDHLQKQCNDAMNTETAAFNSIQTGVIAISGIIALIIGGIMRKYYRLQKQAELAKKDFAEKLAIINEDLESIVRVSSHDLRSPLVNILGFANELAADCKELTEIISQVQMPEEKRKTLMTTLNNNIPEEVNFICKSATKMDTVLQSLTRISKLGSEKLESKTIDMNSLIFDIIDTMQYQLNSNDIDLVIEELQPCTADKTQLTQVFTNLIDNAIKYLDPKRRGRIHISSQPKENSVIYYVTDNGIGIKPKDREKVFEIFHRLSPESDDNGQGLGLSIVSRIVERNNGKVWVDSHDKAGSSFCIELPK